jgi:hypothetical protein
MRWRLSHRADPVARVIADRHYNRQKIGADQFVPPGRCVLVIPDHALWVTSWPFPEYVKHAWAGAWVNSCFRNERRDVNLSSDLILEALAATRYYWEPPRIVKRESVADIAAAEMVDALAPLTALQEPPPPEVAMVTFIDRDKVKRKRDYGRCYRKSGFVHAGETVGGLLALTIRPEQIPAAQAPLGANLSLFAS